MKKGFLIFFLLISLKAFSQSACSGVIIGERISLTYAQASLESLRENTTNGDGNIFPTITDTFQLVDICVVDSVAIVELKGKHNNNDSDDTALFISNRYYLLSKIGLIPSNAERMEVGKYYYLTITPYYPRNYFVNQGGPGMPIILSNTAYEIWFVGNVYCSRSILGKYIISPTKVLEKPVSASTRDDCKTIDN